MSYQVLARKWRPQTFHDVVGQRHVLTALANGLDHQRLHHAYLFQALEVSEKPLLPAYLLKGSIVKQALRVNLVVNVQIALK